jgi:sugar-specific transcriptional regulator TrmB
MMQENQIQALNDIGLSVLQAKTYLSLAKLGKANVGTISKASNLARQDVYRIMPSLEKLGLAEKILTTPTTYKATSMKEGVSILLLKRKRENDEVARQASLLMSTFDSVLTPSDPALGDSQFKITSEETLLFKMHQQLIKKTQSSIDILITTGIFGEHSRRNLFHLRQAVKRGVKIRLIAQENNEKSTFGDREELPGESVMEIRYLPIINPVEMMWFGMHLFDKKEVTLCVSRSGRVPSLWSNSPPILRLAENYYNDLWNSALPYTELKRQIRLQQVRN